MIFFFSFKRENKNGTTYMVCTHSTCRGSITVGVTKGNLITGTPHHHLDREDPSVIEKKIIQQFSMLKTRPMTIIAHIAETLKGK